MCNIHPGSIILWFICLWLGFQCEEMVGFCSNLNLHYILIQYLRQENNNVFSLLVDQTLWHGAGRAAAEGWHCMMRLVGQIHHVAERASGQERSSNKTQTNCRVLYCRFSSWSVWCLCVCVCVCECVLWPHFGGETTMFNPDISTSLAGMRPSCVCLVVVNQPKKRS